jgi:uncharacterized protein with HEPN domain
MPFRDSKSRLRDICDCVNQIQIFVHGMRLNDYLADARAQAAVERKLLLLSQVATKLGGDGEALCPGLPWTGLRSMGRWLQHQYDHVNPEAVWYTINDELPPLRDAVEKALD